MPQHCDNKDCNGILFFGVRLADTTLTENDVATASGLELLHEVSRRQSDAPVDVYIPWVAVTASKVQDAMVPKGCFDRTPEFVNTLCRGIVSAGQAYQNLSTHTVGWFVITASSL